MKNKYTRALSDVHLTEEFREKLGSSLRTSPLLTQPYQEKKSPVKPLGYRHKAYIAACAAAAVMLTIAVLLTTFARSTLPPLPIDSSAAPPTSTETASSTQESSSAATSGQSTTGTKPGGSTTAERTTTSKVSAATTASTTAPTLPRLPCTPGVIPPKHYLETGGWTNENSLVVTMKKPVADKRSWSPADFPEAEVTQILYTSYMKGESLELLLVVRLADGDTLEAAANRLKENAGVETVQPNREVPFESVLVPTYTKIQLRVGETMELGILGGHLYAPNRSSPIALMTEETKTFTTADFPDLELERVEKGDSYESGKNTWYLYLKKAEYFNEIKAVDSLIQSGRFNIVCLDGLEYPGYVESQWTVETPDIADIKSVDSGEYGKAADGRNIVVKALRPGKTTLKYSYYNQASGSAFCEVEVVPG